MLIFGRNLTIEPFFVGKKSDSIISDCNCSTQKKDLFSEMLQRPMLTDFEPLLIHNRTDGLIPNSNDKGL